MKADQVPQDESVLAGLRRACYAENDRGEYVVVPSRGWEVERIVNQYATAAQDKVCAQVRAQVEAGTRSTLAYHMARAQMDAALLAANTGFWRLRVHWHLRPRVFARLRRRTLERYADTLGIAVESLTRLPGRPL